MALVARQISAIITLAASAGTSFNGADTARFDGLRVRVNIVKGGTPQLDTATIRIWGMSQSDMNAVSRLGKPLNWTRLNTITLMAGDAEGGMSQIFTGVMNSAYVDFQPPDASLNIVAISNLVAMTKPAPPSSFPGGVSIATIGQAIATLMGIPFLNSGVTAQLKNQYLTGSAKHQMDKAAANANCWWIPNGGPNSNSLEIWPKGTARGAMGPEVSAATGLVGYPTYTDVGVDLTVLYAPGIEFGQAFTLKSSILPTGTWYVLYQELDLGCNDPEGDNPWYSHITATLVNIQGQTLAQAQATLGNLTGQS